MREDEKDPRKDGQKTRKVRKTVKDPISQKWAERVKEAVLHKCKENGVDPPSKLAKVLKLKEAQWRAIRTGSRITDPDAYAKVFVYLGVPEADPRTIPPLINVGFAAGKGGIVRAWSEKQYNSWLEKEGKKWQKGRQVSGETLPLPRFDERVPTSSIELYSHIMAVLNYVTSQVADRLLEEISAELRGKTKQSPAKALLEELIPIVNGPSAEIDSWVKENREALGDLAPLLEILLQGPGTRGSALRDFLSSSGLGR